MTSASAILKPLFGTLGGIAGLYFGFLALLFIPSLQDHVIYLHKVTLTWFQDVNIPEQWGFLRNQITPFHLATPDGQTLHAWHILPLDVYKDNVDELRKETTGLCSDLTQRLGFKLLKEDPKAKLVLYFHGAAGTLASGHRPQSYRAISAATSKVHILAIDYRGFGTSTGWPSDKGLLTDAMTLAKFAIETIGIPSHRIAIFAQSLGTGVAISLVHHLSIVQSPPTLFSGMVLIAPFADVELLTRTYRIAGTIPLLSPLAKIPGALAFFHKFLRTKFPSKDKLEAIIRHYETDPSFQQDYAINIIHAEDDYDIPWLHSNVLFWHGVNGTRAPEEYLSFEELEEEKEKERVPLGAGGWEVEWRSKGGVLRETILKHGLHDWIMGYPVVSLGIARAFGHGREKQK